MKTAFILYDGMTVLDLVGAYDALVRLKTMGFMPTFEWEVCAWTAEVTDQIGLHLRPTQVGGSLAAYDLLVVPGGHGTRTLMAQRDFLDWLGTFPFATGTAASVCTGSLLLGALGILRDKRATTHRSAFELLRPLCREVVDARVVDEGAVITARGVSSSLYLGLHLCTRLAGPEVTRRIATQMDFDPAT